MLPVAVVGVSIVDFSIAVATGVALGLASTLLSSIYLHRGLAHNLVVYRRPLERCFRILTTWALGINARKWVAIHRLHHAHSDTRRDPHSPRFYSGLEILRTGKMLRTFPDSRAAALASDIPDSSSLAPTIGPGVVLGALLLQLGAGYGILAGLAWVLVSKVSGSGIALWCHRHKQEGRPIYESINRPRLALITWGESLHANHHSDPRRLNLGDSHVADPGYLCVQIMARAGLATIDDDCATTRECDVQ